MDDDLITRAAHVIRTTEIGWEIGPLDDRTLAVALAEAGLLADGTALAQSDADLKAAQARLDAASAKLTAVYELLPIGVCGTHDELFAALAEIRAALTGEEETRG